MMRVLPTLLFTVAGTGLASESPDPTRLDWYRQGLGDVTHATFSTESIYTGSSFGVVASLRKQDGGVNWRRVLPTGGAVDALELRLGVLVSLSDNGRVIKFWKAKTGALKAASSVYSTLSEDNVDAFIDGPSNASSIDTLTDLQIFALDGSTKASHHRVIVTSRNTVTAFGLDGKKKWTWDAATADNTAPCVVATVTPGDSDVQVTCSNVDVVYALDAKLGGWTVVEALDTGEKSIDVHSSEAAAAVANGAAQLAAATQSSKDFRERLTDATVVAAFQGPDSSVALRLADSALVFIDDDGNVAFVREEALSDVAQIVPVALDRRVAAQAASNGQELSGSSFGERLASQVAMVVEFASAMPSELVAILSGGASSAGGASYVRSIGKKLLALLSRSGRLYVLDSVDGSIQWSRQVVTGADASTSALITSASVNGGVHMLLLEGHNARARVFDLLTGTERGAENIVASKSDAPVREILRVALGTEQSEDSCSSGRCGNSNEAVVLAHDDGTVTLVDADGVDLQTVVSALATNVAGGQLYFQHVDYQGGLVSGHVLEATNDGRALRTREMWSVVLGDGLAASESRSVLETCATVDAHEKIQVLGLPFTNDGVLLKYINPNMMACAVTHKATVDDPAVVDVVILDTVTGRSIYRHAHPDSAGPVQMVFSENSLAYSYCRVDNAARTELSAIALYETSLGTYDLLPWKSIDRKTSFSSFDEQMPVVLQKTFTYPEGVRRLAVSQTAHGVSEKAFLVYTASGRVAFLRRDLLDPRRPDSAKPDPTLPLKPYHSHLVQIPTDVVSYHLVIEDHNGWQEGVNADRVRRQGRAQLLSFPTHMESTSEVMVAGLDLFYARFAPSTTYDMLPEEFQKQIIILAAVAVCVATAVAHRMAVKKFIQTAWK